MVNENDIPEDPYYYTYPGGYGGDPLYNASLHFDMEYWLYLPDPWYALNVGSNESIVDLGPTGFAAQTGWYIPTYLTDPKYFDGQLDYWRIYRLPDVAAFFATTATNFKSGEFAGGWSWWGPEADMLKNLKFNFTAVWYNDSLLKNLEAKYLTHSPLFTYLWTPLGVCLL